MDDKFAFPLPVEIPEGLKGIRAKDCGVCQDLLTRIEALPDVSSVSLAYLGPFGGGRYVQEATVDGFSPRSGTDQLIEADLVTSGYLATIGAQLMIGRPLAASDGKGGPQVAVVNETFARRFFGESSPVGQRFGVEGEDSSQDVDIVGMVADFKQHDLRGDVPPMPIFKSPREGTPPTHF